jgi:hypothetical protein
MPVCRFCEFENRDVNLVADHMLLVHPIQVQEWLRPYIPVANVLPESELQDVDFSE